MFNACFLQGIQKDTVNERNFQEEALLLAKVAKICRAEVFKNDITFSGSFNKGCQDILSVVYQLISMILYGPYIHPDISTSFRNSPKREPPVPVYMGLSMQLLEIKKMIESFEQLITAYYSYNQ